MFLAALNDFPKDSRKSPIQRSSRQLAIVCKLALILAELLEQLSLDTEVLHKEHAELKIQVAQLYRKCDSEA